MLDGEPKILADEPIVRLLGPDGLAQLKSRPDAFQSPGARRLRAHVLLRSRFAEDRLADAVRRGVRQYVVLGAGLDTFALRQPEWARDITIVEIDQPATQSAKRARLAELGVEAPKNVVFAPVDFETTTLGQASLPTFWRNVFEQAVYRRYSDFAKGVIDTGNIVFFVAVTAVFLFMTVKVMESRRWK